MADLVSTADQSPATLTPPAPEPPKRRYTTVPVPAGYYDRETAAAQLGLSPGTLAVWRCTRKFENELPCGRVGKRCLYRVANVLVFRERHFPARRGK